MRDSRDLGRSESMNKGELENVVGKSGLPQQRRLGAVGIEGDGVSLHSLLLIGQHVAQLISSRRLPKIFNDSLSRPPMLHFLALLFSFNHQENCL